jgi:hypothetical protein
LKFTFRVIEWDKSGEDKEVLGSSGVKTSSFGDESALWILSMDDPNSLGDVERGKSSELVSAKVT